MWDILRFLEFTYPYPYIILAGNLNKSLVCNDIIGRKAQDAKSEKGLPTNIRIINQSFRYRIYGKMSLTYFLNIGVYLLYPICNILKFLGYNIEC